MKPTIVLALLLASVLPAAAHHTGTPPIVRFSSSGDNALPRLPPLGGLLALALDGGTTHPIVSLHIWDKPNITTTLASAGVNANPSVALSPIVAWDSDGDPLGSGDPGRQIFLAIKGTVFQVTHDPSGTSANPAVNWRATRIAFESAGNLTGTAPPGTQQIYVHNADDTLLQVSRGAGTSANPALNRLGARLAFDSTTDPLDETRDTGVPQIWFANVDSSPARAVTDGLGASRNPGISTDGRIVVFESTADLAHGGADTGVPQVFAYDVPSGTFAQVTADAGGCIGASVHRDLADWRVAFTCAGQGYYYELRRDHRYHVQTPDGDVNRVIAAFGTYFVGISTTANLLGTGTTAGHQVYLVNLFKRPAEPVPGTAVWFPTRGLRALR